MHTHLQYWAQALRMLVNEMMRHTNLGLLMICFMEFVSSVTTCGCYASPHCAGDCSDIKDLGFNSSGIYRIYPGGLRNGINVFCEMGTNGGGWLVFQRRIDGSENFTRSWSEYQFGFGDVYGEHWLGNVYLNMITSQSLYELRIDMEDWEGGKMDAKYHLFKVGDVSQKYVVYIEGYHGKRYNNSMIYHNGKPFSINFRDHSQNNCTAIYQNGWWYSDSGGIRANLNGLYIANGETTKECTGIIWKTWKGLKYSLKSTEMKIRRT